MYLSLFRLNFHIALPLKKKPSLKHETQFRNFDNLHIVMKITVQPRICLQFGCTDSVVTFHYLCIKSMTSFLNNSNYIMSVKHKREHDNLNLSSYTLHPKMFQLIMKLNRFFFPSTDWSNCLHFCKEVVVSTKS